MFSVVAEHCLYRSKDFYTFHAALTVRRLRVHQKLWGDTTRTGDPDWTKGYPIPYNIMISNKHWGNEGGREGLSEWWYFSSQETIMHDEPCFPRSDWAPACQCEIMNEFLVLFCWSVHLLLYLVNCLYLSPWVLALLPFWFSSPSHLGRVSGQLCGA